MQKAIAAQNKSSAADTSKSSGSGGNRVYYSGVPGWRPENDPNATVIYVNEGQQTGTSVGAGQPIATTVPVYNEKGEQTGTQTVSASGKVQERDLKGNLIPEKSGQAKPEDVAAYLKQTSEILRQNQIQEDRRATAREGTNTPPNNVDVATAATPQPPTTQANTEPQIIGVTELKRSTYQKAADYLAQTKEESAGKVPGIAAGLAGMGLAFSKTVAVDIPVGLYNMVRHPFKTAGGFLKLATDKQTRDQTIAQFQYSMQVEPDIVVAKIIGYAAAPSIYRKALELIKGKPMITDISQRTESLKVTKEGGQVTDVSASEIAVTTKRRFESPKVTEAQIKSVEIATPGTEAGKYSLTGRGEGVVAQRQMGLSNREPYDIFTQTRGAAEVTGETSKAVRAVKVDMMQPGKNSKTFDLVTLTKQRVIQREPLVTAAQGTETLKVTDTLANAQTQEMTAGLNVEVLRETRTGYELTKWVSANQGIGEAGIRELFNTPHSVPGAPATGGGTVLIQKGKLLLNDGGTQVNIVKQIATTTPPVTQTLAAETTTTTLEAAAEVVNVEVATPYPQKTETKPAVIQTTRSAQATETVQRTRTEIKTTREVIPRTATALDFSAISGSKTTPALKVGIDSSSDTTQQFKQIQEPQLDQKTEQTPQIDLVTLKITTGITTFTPGTPPPPPPPPPVIARVISPTFAKGNKGTFTVFLRRQKQFKKEKTFTTEEAALRFGKARVEQTAAASFKVESSGQKIRGQAARLGRKFYESAREPGVYIQKNTFRISSRGEKNEIPFQAARIRKIFG